VNSEIWWYSARVGGVVAWVLLAAALLAAAVLPARVLARWVAPSTTLGAQRRLTATAAAFTALHLLGLLLADHVRLGATDLVVPLAAPEQPRAVAWGILAAVLLVAVVLASLLTRRAGRRASLAVHVASLIAFVTGTAHMLAMSGTDIDRPVVWWSAALAAAMIVGANVVRLATSGNPRPPAGPPATTQDDVALGLQARERDVPTWPDRDTGRADLALIERTLAGLRSLDDRRPTVTDPVVLPGPFDFLVPPPVDEDVPADPVGSPEPEESRLLADESDRVPDPAVPAAPLPLTSSQALSGSLLPSGEDLLLPAGPLDGSVPAGVREREPETQVRDVAATDDVDGRAPRSSATPPVTAVARDLPVRTPRRVARTTSAADRLDAWQPSRAASASRVRPPLPPAAVDPVTGEPDAAAYRQWLKEWLAYVESQG
jgi:hypothetical protein